MPRLHALRRHMLAGRRREHCDQERPPLQLHPRPHHGGRGSGRVHAPDRRGPVEVAQRLGAGASGRQAGACDAAADNAVLRERLGPQRGPLHSGAPTGRTQGQAAGLLPRGARPAGGSARAARGACARRRGGRWRRLRAAGRRRWWTRRRWTGDGARRHVHQHLRPGCGLRRAFGAHEPGYEQHFQRLPQARQQPELQGHGHCARSYHGAWQARALAHQRTGGEANA
mmetsp:Transcript_89058/g.247445  ORF Transcript_89058/g.247445 Transcript_89058/m.247445 type:complete len:227 (+) Transcript_89058:643-1323(+)